MQYSEMRRIWILHSWSGSRRFYLSCAAKVWILQSGSGSWTFRLDFWAEGSDLLPKVRTLMFGTLIVTSGSESPSQGFESQRSNGPTLLCPKISVFASRSSNSLPSISKPLELFSDTFTVTPWLYFAQFRQSSVRYTEVQYIITLNSGLHAKWDQLIQYLENFSVVFDDGLLVCFDGISASSWSSFSKGLFGAGIVLRGLNIFILELRMYSWIRRNKMKFLFGLQFSYSKNNQFFVWWILWEFLRIVEKVNDTL